jgi:hypothetical protein
MRISASRLHFLPEGATALDPTQGQVASDALREHRTV